MYIKPVYIMFVYITRVYITAVNITNIIYCNYAGGWPVFRKKRGEPEKKSGGSSKLKWRQGF